ncbi:SdrD B-like domain-containing protein [Paraglaciecola aestuariivivens]
MLRQLKSWVLLILLMPCSIAAAEVLIKSTIDQDNYVLVDIVLNNKTIVRSIDMYFVEDRQFIAIEPLLDALKVRYQLSDTRLVIWQKNTPHEYQLTENQSNTKAENSLGWATDNFYMFVELAVFESIFAVELKYKSRQLKLEMFVPRDQPIFPVQILAEQEEKRLLERLTSRSKARSRDQQLPITIQDQYRAFTIPHGRVNFAAEQSDDGAGFNSSIQLTSDLLYHSAQLTLTKSKDADLVSRLILSRYKSSPDDYILGLYDQYQFGDISSRNNNLTTRTTSGVGAIFERRSQNFRDTNQFITLKESAPPGWEAELFRNQVFLGATTVPDNGLLIFDEVEVTYGQNNYTIKLYGPYGETDVITKQYELTQNALSKGQSAHSVYAFDRNKQLLNDNSIQDYSITDFGGTFDYGVTDNWQVGVGFAGLEGDQQLVSLSNALSLPGMLLENDFSIDQDGNYAQITSLRGSAFSKDKYNINFESGNNYQNQHIDQTGKRYLLDASYFLNTSLMGVTFGTNYLNDDIVESYGISNRLSGNIGRLLVRHNLAYTERKFKSGILTDSSNILGSLGISGTLPYKFRVSANINYDPQASDVILDSSSVVIQKNIEDPWGTRHYLTFNYLPIAQEFRDKWRLTHRVSWRTGDYQLNLANEIGDNDSWSIQLGLQFFLGYDYRNNRLTLSHRLLPNTASLDVHAYLDRQINGIPDPLDYNLEGVSFSGNPEWEGIETGEEGRAVLPGVYANHPFRFSAKWKDGSNTINNDYVVFTHPGAYIQANMPFVLSTELIGFVLRENNNQEIGLQNMTVELYDEKNNLIQVKDTDLDGYYEFLGLSPGKYRVSLKTQGLREKGYTSDTVGFDVTTGGNGGYAELPAIVLRRVGDSGNIGAEQFEPYRLDSSNTEPSVWDNDAEVRKNYFTLPTKNEVKAVHSLDEDELATVIKAVDSVTAEKDSETQSEVNKQQKRKPNQDTLPVVKLGWPEFTSHSLKDDQLSIEPLAKPDKTDVKQVHSDESKGITYVIQLGIYKDVRHAHKVVDELSQYALEKDAFSFIQSDEGETTRLVYGRFANKLAGLSFANKHIPKGRAFFIRPMKSNELSKVRKNTTAKGEWVIQWYASKSPLTKAIIKQKFPQLSQLYMAQKNTDSGQVYCVISQAFKSKREAQLLLSSLGYSGWVVNRASFEKTSPFESVSLGF